MGGFIARQKGRSFALGFALGLFFALIGVIIVALLPGNEEALEMTELTSGTSKKCPYCAELIKPEAVVCRYCGRELPVNEDPSAEVVLSKEEFLALTQQQRSTVVNYGYLVSPEEAETVWEMISDLKSGEVPAFCASNGKKVLNVKLLKSLPLN